MCQIPASVLSHAPLGPITHGYKVELEHIGSWSSSAFSLLFYPLRAPQAGKVTVNLRKGLKQMVFLSVRHLREKWHV